MSETEEPEVIEAEVVEEGLGDGESAEATEKALTKEAKTEKAALAKRYFHPFIREADAKLAKLPGIRRGEASAKVRALLRGADGMERSALMEIMFLYSFAGMTSRDIANHMQVDKRIITSVVLDPRFAQGYERFRKEVVGKIADAMTQRVSETMIDALELKITLMNKSKSEWLRNTIANEILAMGGEITQGKKEGVSKQLEAIWERAIKKQLPDGSVLTETQTLKKALE